MIDNCHWDYFRFHRLEPVGLVKGYTVECLKHEDKKLCFGERTLFCWIANET